MRSMLIARGFRFFLASALLVTLACVSMPGWAQPGGGAGGGRGPRLSPEESKAAQAVEAQYAARKLGLKEDVTAQLVTAYQAAREGFASALAKKREEAAPATEDRGARMAAFRKMTQEVRTEECAKFETALKGFLTEEQTKKAIELLGSFNFQLDYLVNVLAGFKLGDEEDKALDLVNGYLAEQSKLWDEPGAGQGGLEAVRDKQMALKADLDKALGEILSAEQMTAWTTATSRPQGGGPRGGEGPRGGGRGAQPPAEGPSK